MTKKIVLGTALFVFLSDQVVKAFVVNNNLAYHLNPAGILGLFGSFKLIIEMLAYISLILIIIFSLIAKISSTLEALAFGLLFGGGLGNLSDRLNHNGVIDFLKFPVPLTKGQLNYNVADIAITSSVIIMVINFIQKTYAQSKNYKSR